MELQQKIEHRSEEINKGLVNIRERLGLKELSEINYFPKYFEIDLAGVCNARCSMCTVWKDPKEMRYMNDELFVKILDEMRNYSDWINVVCLSRNGEPLLYRNLSQRISELKKIGIKNVNFSTNAALLTDKKSIELIESGLDDIKFSIDGSTKETFETIREGLNFEKVVNNCLRFIELRNERGMKPRVQIRMVLQERNQHEEEAWIKFWTSKVSEHDKVMSKKMNNWGNQLKTYSREDEKEKYAHVPCISPFSSFVVLYDGKVPLCGVDFDAKHLMGNLNDDNIKEIWNSDNFNKIREIHSTNRNQIDLCIGCNIWDLNEKKVYNEQLVNK